MKEGVYVFQERIKELRLSKKLTQQEVADRIGITRPAYTAYESGKRQPDFDTLETLAQLYEVTTDYLLGRNKVPKWASKSEVIELDKILQSNVGMAYGEEGPVTDEDREAINDLIASYYWRKKQKKLKKQE